MLKSKMFDKTQSRIIIILGLSGVFAGIISLFLLSRTPNLELEFPLEKQKILESADKFIKLQQLPTQYLVKKSFVASDQEGLVYLQKTLGIEKTNSLLRTLPLYYWQIDYIYQKNKSVILFSREQKQTLRLIINPINGKIMGFNRSAEIPSFQTGDECAKIIPTSVGKLSQENFPTFYESGADRETSGFSLRRFTLSKRESEAKANDFFDLIDFDISQFKMTNYSSVEGKYTFEWEKPIPELRIAKLKARLEIFGDRIGRFSYFVEIPQEELKKYPPSGIGVLILFIILNTLVVFLGIFVLVISILKRRKLDWKFSFIFALLILPTFLISFFKLSDYSSGSLAMFLFISAASSIIYFVWTVMVLAAARFFAHESKINMFPVKIFASVLLSYIFVFSGLGFTMFLFIFVLKIFKPVATLGFYSFFSSFPSFRFSYLLPPLLSLYAAITEEIFFRALLVSFLKRHLKTAILAIIASSLVWSFLHVSPFIDSDIYPVFVKGIMLVPIGLLFGYIFIRFGIICAIATHYLHDLIVMGFAFLEFNNFRRANENIIVLLIAAILPLLIAAIRRLKNYKEYNA